MLSLYSKALYLYSIFLNIEKSNQIFCHFYLILLCTTRRCSRVGSKPYPSYTPLLNKVYRLVIVFLGTVNAMPSLIARQTGSGQWGPIPISPFGEKWQFLGYIHMFTKKTPFFLSPASVDAIEQRLIARQNNSHMSLN